VRKTVAYKHPIFLCSKPAPTEGQHIPSCSSRQEVESRGVQRMDWGVGCTAMITVTPLRSARLPGGQVTIEAHRSQGISYGFLVFSRLIKGKVVVG